MLNIKKLSPIEMMVVDGRDGERPKLPAIDRFHEGLEVLRRKQCEESFQKCLVAVTQLPMLQRHRAVEDLAKVTELKPGTIKAMSDAAIEKLENADFKTHNEIACHYASTLGEHVGNGGDIWVWDSPVYRPITLKAIAVDISRKYGGKLCRTWEQNKSVAEMIYEAARDDDFFTKATPGIALQDGFWCIEDGGIVRKEHSPDHRAIHYVDAVPKPGLPSMLLDTLHEAFEDHHPVEQIRQVQQIFGLVLFQLLSKEQRAVFFLGAPASGKSTILKLLTSMFPETAVSSVSPLEWDDEKAKAAMANKLLNAVPEIDRDAKLPASQFKGVTGQDKIMARMPFKEPFFFVCSAAQVFNGNFHPVITDTTEAFWRRWLMVRFARTRPAGERITDYHEKIMANEMGQILQWAFEGVLDYLEGDGKKPCVYESPQHHEEIIEWRGNANSVMVWLNDIGENGLRPFNKDIPDAGSIKVKECHKQYQRWCGITGMRPFVQTQFKVRMAEAGYPAKKATKGNIFPGLTQDTSFEWDSD